MNKLLIGLTRGYIWTLGGKFKKIVKYKLPNKEVCEIFVFSKKDHHFAGQNVPFLNTIIIEENVLKTYPKLKANFVVAHELGHKKINFILNFIITILFIPAMLIGLYAIMLVPIITLLTLILPNIFPFYLVISLIICVIIFSLIIILISWPIELIADFYAYSIIGEKKLPKLLIKNKWKRKKKKVLREIIYFLTQPSTKLSISLYKWKTRIKKPKPL